MVKRFSVDSSLQVYDTARRALVPFEPLVTGEVRVYVCGPTVYDLCHIGHGRSYLVWDMIRRYLEFRGYRVLYVQNFTDIDDKIIARARELGTTESELALQYIDEYFRDTGSLGIRPADVHPRATTHISAMAELISELLDRQAAYVTAGGSVYFRVDAFPQYGMLSGRKLEDMMAGARVEVSEEKDHPLDFAVWKAAKPDEPVWEIAVANRTLRGRPGWHLECSAMVRQHMGDTIDIHCGGSDLVFPHHENEIAQSMSATGKQFARYWLHNGFINIEGEKMSKSLRNFVTLRELLQRYDGDTIRYFVLQKYYRTPMDFSEDALEAAKNGLKSLRNSYRDLEALDGSRLTEEEYEAFRNSQGNSLAEMMQDTYMAFVRAMDQDFGTPEAVAVINNHVRALYRYRGWPITGEFKAARDLAELLAGVLGFSLERHDQAVSVGIDQIGNLVERLLEWRKKARVSQDFGLADEIRKLLTESSIEVNDQSGGITTWRIS